MKTLLVLFIIWFVLKLTMKKQKDIITIHFGVPGCGKSTVAARLARKDIKKKINVWSNVGITGAYQLNPKEDIGKHMIEDGHIIIDEAGIEYNNRNTKCMSQEAIAFFKYHRHYKTRIDIFSQSHEDCDITLRRLAQKWYITKPSIIPYFITEVQIKKKIGINKDTKQIEDQYYKVPILGTKRYFAPSAWKYFNTLSRKQLPKKDWKKWGEKENESNKEESSEISTNISD